MKRWTGSMIAIAILLGIGVTIFPAVAEDDNKLSVPVAFGRGLNTAQAGNIVNHVIIPNNIDTKLDGVVHFLVAGFHQVVVYKPGTRPDDIDVPTSGTFINDPNNLYYLGINPAGGPGNTQATPANPIIAGSDVRSNALNRVESVSFPASVGTGTPPSTQAEKGDLSGDLQRPSAFCRRDVRLREGPIDSAPPGDVPRATRLRGRVALHFVSTFYTTGMEHSPTRRLAPDAKSVVLDVLRLVFRR